MTTYRLLDGAAGRPGPNGPALNAYTATPFEAGMAVKVTQGGMWADSFWWWVPAGGDTAPQTFCLWNITGTSGAGSVVPGSEVLSGTLTANSWNEIVLPSPVQIAIGATYVPATAWTPAHGFPITSGQFGSGDPYSAGIASGPLTAFGDDTSGGTNGAPYGLGQGLFGTVHSDPTAGPPLQLSGSSIFWIDLKADDTAPGGYAGPWRLWPNMGDALGWMLDLAHNYILGTEITLSTACTLDKVWFYSPPGAGQLPTDAAIWDVASQTMVAGTHQSSPSWSGAAGSGWVSVSYSGVTLASGGYKVSVFNGAASPQVFNATTAGYFTTGAGASGIISGPITCPNASGATSPGQCTYQDTTGSPSFIYPDLYVDGEGQNYWLDWEVTPVSGTPHTATASLTVTPSLSAGRSRGQHRGAALTVAPSLHAGRSQGHVRTGALVVSPAFSAAVAGGAAAPATGSWWGLDNVFKQSKQEFEAFISRPPMACPLDGEPLRNPPNTRAGSGMTLYCRFCGWQYPRDYVRPVRL
jgi:hypothetical protein